jgi:hypothetical protein
MLHLIHLSLVPITWSQTLTYEGATILRARMKCAPRVRCELKLRDGTRLTEHEIELTILNGEMRAEDRVKYKLVEEAIGGLWFVDDKDFAAFVHGWLFVAETVYDAIWDEVRRDGYTGCNFSLDAGPVEGKGMDDERWGGNPLPILGASISFDRKPPIDERPARKGWFGR